MTTGRILLVLAALAALLAGARASPLDAETCEKLLSEHGTLESAGVEADMAKGPEWARANLGLEKLERIRRFIEVTEQLVFRCRQKSLVSLPSENEGDQKDKDDDKDDTPRVPPSGTTDKAKSDGKAKGDGKANAPPAAKKKSNGPATKAAVQPASKPTPKPQPKQSPDAAKAAQKQPPERAKAPAKQPAAGKDQRTPPKAEAKGAKNAKDGDD